MSLVAHLGLRFAYGALRSKPQTPLVFLLAFGATACSTLATGPDWTGGGLETIGPIRAAEREEIEEKERARMAKMPSRVGARHILVMHQKSLQKPENVTRTREEARARADQCLAALRSGAAWESVVGECSDEPGAAERNGDLGVFERGAMVKAFSDAAFVLEVKAISDLVETPYGFHIIQRTE
jgi:peptidyl-prolyl cis-trans isomerase NIMA-interacting 1